MQNVLLQTIDLISATSEYALNFKLHSNCSSLPPSGDDREAEKLARFKSTEGTDTRVYWAIFIDVFIRSQFLAFLTARITV